MNKLLAFLFLLIASSCSSTQSPREHQIISMQLIDRNGFSETISTKDRIKKYQTTDFLSPQPYQKVLRVYAKSPEGKSPSFLTSYHPNGHIWQYLSILDGRAHGEYKEWYPSGKLRMHLEIIEGFADLQESSQRTWVFDGKNLIYDENGNLTAEILYDKGMLHDTSTYFYSSGSVQKTIPFSRNAIHGQVSIYFEDGHLKESLFYQDGCKEGISTGYWKSSGMQYRENYSHDLLLEGTYLDVQGQLLSEIIGGSGWKSAFDNDTLHSRIEYTQGKAIGKVEIYSPEGAYAGFYHQAEGKKNGEEVLFYPMPIKNTKPIPKLSVNWTDDALEGEVKTWYENGICESQRQFHSNKKHGVCLSWYKNGDLMLMEEYDHDAILKASYFKKGDKKPVSKIENGKGTATLFSSDGRFQKTIHYEKGVPMSEPK